MLSIIFLNYRTSRDIHKCLESIVRFESHYKDYEFIIVDNNSNDKGLELIKREFPFVKLIYAPENGGFAYGNNIGIKEASGDYLFLLNPDTYLEDNSIEKLYNKIKSSNDIAIIGPQLLYPDGRNQSFYEPKAYLTLWILFCEKFYFYKIFKNIKILNSYYRTYMDYSKEAYVEQVCGAAFMFRKELIDAIGYLDDKYFMYFEEADFCLRAAKNGFKMLYYPSSQIFHIGGLISESNWERSTRDFIYSFKFYFKKNFGLLHYFMAIFIYVLGTLIRIIGLGFLKDKKSYYYIYHLKYILKNK